MPLPFFGSAHHGRRGGWRDAAGAAGAAAAGGTPAALGGEVGDRGISVAPASLGAGDHPGDHLAVAHWVKQRVELVKQLGQRQAKG